VIDGVRLRPFAERVEPPRADDREDHGRVDDFAREPFQEAFPGEDALVIVKSGPVAGGL